MKKILVLIFIIFIGGLTVFGYFYLDKHWEEWSGPKAEEFCTFYQVNTQIEESTDNKTFCKIRFKLSVHRDMYFVEISPQDRTFGVTEIISFDDEIGTTRTLKAGTVIYPNMVVQLENTSRLENSMEWVSVRITFKDIDNREKEIIRYAVISSLPYPPTAVALYIVAMLTIIVVCIFIVVSYLSKRKKRKKREEIINKRM